ncbi:DNA mismatch repair protein MutS [Lachnospiraceae bacterium NSJ-29]|uniref:DNA mismatch repair protein MutS n=2 Tax=Wansuia hejianensis TaxID=2763667 RepID=A0A926F233_9FIRM|nr:DNA mismatch repair protein MutS [Wansuia hejianensis]MBC8590539.1 DNA mismatch repair protein MutS [Wansuia hejianensis]
MNNLTPMMKQYMSLKYKYKDSILFFRLGDFYEMFFDDALIASKELEITLTKRDCGMEKKAPMCGVPHHVADTYIARLVEKGYKVAICEQVEDPALAKGIVKRDVIKVVTPGTITDSNVLDEKTNNYLVSVYMDKFGCGISYADNSTGEIYTTEFLGGEFESFNFIINELGKISPSEIICNEGFSKNKKYINIIKNKINPYFTVYKDICDKQTICEKGIIDLFQVPSLKDLNIDDKLYSILSLNKLIDYLYDTEKTSLDHINNLVYYNSKDYMVMDINTRTNLEIHETIMSKERKGALVHVIDKTSTSMGGRLLKTWLDQPLVDIYEIDKRLDMVEYFYDNIIFADQVNEQLKKIYDIERLSSKISNGNCNGRDLISLKNSISVLPNIKSLLDTTNNQELTKIGNNIDPLSDIFSLIDIAIEENPPISIKEGRLIKKGYNKELDEIRIASIEGKEWLASLEAKERESTGIKNLKVGYNKVAGYFFEVTKANTSLVPNYFIRKQTLTNSERYYTDELKSMESKILGAEERALELEYEIFQVIRNNVKKEIKRIQYTGKLISIIDVLLSFSKVALQNNYIRPILNNNGYIRIKEGRHPVVERSIENDLFVPNDTYLDQDDSMIQIITGPNMAGKSTYMRQVAIITLLAQVGSFVPAKHAEIGIVDRIFTRIGASDNLYQGESTFMVEMNEVANIIRDATSNSLIILDEVGRGTSTYDGLSIAWAVVEHIATNIRAKTLFATHYHELTQLTDKYKQIKNMTITAKEDGDDIVFLRKIVEGSTNKSYGIQVARLAGINNKIINRAHEILSIIEGSHEININKEAMTDSTQLSLSDYKKDNFINKIINIDIDRLTPIDSLTILNNLIQDAIDLKEN